MSDLKFFSEKLADICNHRLDLSLRLILEKKYWFLNRKKKKIHKADQAQKMQIIYAISHFYWTYKMPNCTLAPSNIRKKTLFSTVFGWRSSYRIFYWQKFSNNTPFVTCARYNKLYTVLQLSGKYRQVNV